MRERDRDRSTGGWGRQRPDWSETQRDWSAGESAGPSAPGGAPGEGGTGRRPDPRRDDPWWRGDPDPAYGLGQREYGWGDRRRYGGGPPGSAEGPGYGDPANGWPPQGETDDANRGYGATAGGQSGSTQGREGRFGEELGRGTMPPRDWAQRFGQQPDWGRGGSTGGYGTEDAAGWPRPGRQGWREPGDRDGGDVGERGYGQSVAGEGGYGPGGYGGGYGQGADAGRRWERRPRTERGGTYGQGGDFSRPDDRSVRGPGDTGRPWYGEWWRPGEFTGRGPRGYRRSDERIRDDVSDRLEQSGAIDATDIEVAVADGVVTLRGKVDDRGQKRMAEDLADSCPGVRDVENELKVRRSLIGVMLGRDDDPSEGSTTQAARSKGGTRSAPSDKTRRARSRRTSKASGNPDQSAAKTADVGADATSMAAAGTAANGSNAASGANDDASRVASSGRTSAMRRASQTSADE